jgi:hypothetical protein
MSIASLRDWFGQVNRCLNAPLPGDLHEPVHECTPIVYGLPIDPHLRMLDASGERTARRQVDLQPVESNERNLSGYRLDRGKEPLRVGCFTSVRAVQETRREQRSNRRQISAPDCGGELVRDIHDSCAFIHECCQLSSLSGD